MFQIHRLIIPLLNSDPTCAEAAPKQLGPRHMVWPVRCLRLAWVSPIKIIEIHWVSWISVTKPGWFSTLNRNMIVATPCRGGLSIHHGLRYSIPPSVNLLFGDGKEKVRTRLANGSSGVFLGSPTPGLAMDWDSKYPTSQQVDLELPFVRLTLMNYDLSQVLNPLFYISRGQHFLHGKHQPPITTCLVLSLPHRRGGQPANHWEPEIQCTLRRSSSCTWSASPAPGFGTGSRSSGTESWQYRVYMYTCVCMCIYIYIYIHIYILFHTIWFPGKRACISQMQRYGFMMIHSVMTSTLPMWLLRAKNFLNHNLWHEKPLGNILVSCDKIYPFPSFQHVLGQSTKDQKGAQQNKPVARTKKM